MALPFRDFLNSLVGGSGGDPNIPPYSQPVPSGQPVPPVQGPMPVQELASLQHPGVYPVPAQQPMQFQGPQGPVAPMDPATFAAYQQQAPVQGPDAPVGSGRDLGGTWVSIQYTYNGMVFNLLVPEEKTVNLPEGARVIPNGTITNEPERVQRAIDEGERGIQGQHFVGTLDQAPPEIQGLFRSSEDVFNISQGRPIEPLPLDQEGNPVPWNAGMGDLSQPTTQIYPTNPQGQNAGDVEADQREFDALMQQVMTVANDPDAMRRDVYNERGESVAGESDHPNAGTAPILESVLLPPLTTEMLRQTDPVKAGILEEAGIFEVPANRMVVRDQNGVVRMIPHQQEPSPGMEIITYGGNTPRESGRNTDMGPLAWLTEQLERPQRWLQGGFSSMWNDPPTAISWLFENITEPGLDASGRILDHTPLGMIINAIPWGDASTTEIVQTGTYGFPAFAAWMELNPEEADAARTGGYNGFTGERAVWERFQADRNLVQRTIDSLTTDPLNVLPSMGAPLRGASRAVRSVRTGTGVVDGVADATSAARGVGWIDESLPATQRAQQTFVNAADDFANAPTVIDDAPFIQRGVGTIDESVTPPAGQVIPQPDVPTGPMTPTQRGLALTEDALNAAATVLDVPEAILGAVLDRVIIQPGGILIRGIGRIPLPEGRSVSDIFDISEGTAARNARYEAETQLEDVIAQRSVDDVPPGTAADAVDTTPGPEAPSPAAESPYPGGRQVAPDVEQPPLSRPVEPEVPAPTAPPTPDTTPRQSPLTRPVEPEVPARPLTTDRPIEDLGRAPDEVPRQQELPTDRPIDDLASPREDVVPIPRTETVEGPIDTRLLADDVQEQEFLTKSRAIRGDSRVYGSGDDPGWARFTQPQPRQNRISGAGRAGRDFQMRAQDVAREIAPSLPDGDTRWDRFVSRVNSRAKKFRTLEEARVADNSWPNFDDKRAYEMMLEGSHYAEDILPRFRAEFGDVVEMPEYYWKRWGPADNSHTALDSLEQMAIRDMRSNELVEVAMFHPERGIDSPAARAVEELEQRYARKTDTGEIVRHQPSYAVSYDPNIRPELRGKTQDGKTVGMGRGMFSAIGTTRRSYLKELDADLAFTGDRVGVGRPTRSLSEEALGTVDPEGARAFQDALARRETPQDAPGQPQTPQGVSEPSLTGEMPTAPQAATPAGAIDNIASERVARNADPEGADVFDRALDPEGAARFDQDLAAGALRDVGEQPSPLPLGERALSAIDDSVPGFSPGRRGELEQAADAVQGVADRARPLALTERAMSAINDSIPVGSPSATRAMDARTGAVTRGTLDPTFTERAAAIKSIAESRAAAPPPRESGFMDGRREARERFRATRLENRLKERQGPQTRMTPDELDSFYVRGRQPSATQMRVLGQTFDDGESIIARWDRYTAEEIDRVGDAVNIKDAENRAAQRVLNDWSVSNLNEREIVQYRRNVEKNMQGRRGQTPEGESRQMTELEAQIRALESLQDRAGRTRFGKAYDDTMIAIRQAFLYNVLTGPRYIQTQLIGNNLSLALTKHYGVMGDVISSENVRGAIRLMKRSGDFPPGLLEDVGGEYGLGGSRTLTRGSNQVRDQTSGGLGDEMKIRRVPVLGKLSPILANKRIRDIAAWQDMLPREALWASMMDSNLAVARNTLRERMLATAPNTANAREINEIFDALPQRFSSSDIREQFGMYGQRWSDRHARDWQEAVSKTDRAARDEVTRVFFDGGERNIDLLAKRVVFFHYWMSRATPLYTEAIARDPVYMYNFVKLIETLRRHSEQGDYGSGPNGFVKLMQSPMGYNIMVRPDAMLQTLAQIWDNSGYTPEGESMLGRFLRESGAMTNPILQSLAYVSGLVGEGALPPDPVGANKWIQLANATIDYANSEFGLNWGSIAPNRNPQDDMLAWLQHQITSNLSWVPGINEIPYRDPMSYKENEVRSIIADVALERGMSLDDPVVQNAMVDSESELYQEAMKRYGAQDLMDIGMRMLPVVAVLYPKSQLASPRERSAAMARERELAQQMGTGSTEAGQQLYADRDNIAASSEYSRTMQLQQDEYQGMGTPEERAALNFWYSIRYASTEEPIWVGGQKYRPEQIQVMESGEREQLANQWATETGNTERIENLHQERKDYRDNHPEYAEFVQWRAQIGDYQGGVFQWWEDVGKGNPNAARWFNDLPRDQQENEAALTGLDAYMAYQGEKQFSWENDPIETRTEIPPDPYNPIGDDQSSGSSGSSSSGGRTRGPTQDGIQQQISQYQEDLAAYNAAASQYLGQPVDVDRLNPQVQAAVVSNLRDMGFTRPRMGGYLYDYLQWAETQGGGDASVTSYIAWWNQQNPGGEEEEPAA